MNEEHQNDTKTPGADGGEEPTTETRENDRRRLEDERDQLEQKLQRALADLANMRRRQRQEIDENRHRVLEGLTQELLPVLDTFGMALQAYDAQADGDDAAGGDTKALVEGVRLVRTMLSGVLERHGLQEIPSTGPFDPNHHEAVAMEPSDEVPEGHIVRVMLTGYLLGDRVVRHSRVVVSGTATAEDDTGPED